MITWTKCNECPMKVVSLVELLGCRKKPKVIVNHSFWITLFAGTLYYQARQTFVVLRSKVKLILNSYLCIINLFLNCGFTLKLILYYSKKRYWNLYNCFMHVYHWYWLRIFIGLDSIQLYIMLSTFCCKL